jgi:hypothetical protein
MGRAARLQQEASVAPLCARGFTTDLAAFASVSHPSALKRLRVCQRGATVPDDCISLFAFPAACLAVYRALPSRGRAGAAGESSQWGHGRGAERRRWVESREKWLYFSYTLSPTMVYSGWQGEEVTSDSQMYIMLAAKRLSPLAEQTEALRRSETS